MYQGWGNVFSVVSFQKISERLMEWSKETEWKYIVLDEIGLLELRQQQGLYEAFIYLLDNAASSLIVVIREVCWKWPLTFAKSIEEI